MARRAISPRGRAPSKERSSAARTQRYPSPYTVYGLAGIALCALLTGLLHRLVGWAWPWAYVLGINVATMALYAWDKGAARRDGSRIPELVLHGLAALGGTPAALASQRLFRHKTRKSSFQAVFLAIAAMQLLAFGLAAYYLGWL